MTSRRDELARTLPAQEYLASSAAPAPPPTPAGPEPASDRPGVADRLRQLGYPFPQRARIEVGDQLGAGATGRVFAALDHDLERPIAVKVLASDGQPSPEAVAGFIEEARITAALAHPNVLPVHEVEVNARGQIFFTMKRVDGRSLGSALEASTAAHRVAPLDDANALVNVFIGVGQALAYAHRRRVAHQDVKPDNIMLGELGEVLLVDWGSARRLDQPGGQLYGTPLYMSPEQARGEPADERSDVYCLGATMFHGLTMRLPTWSEDSDEFWARKRAGQVDPPAAAERAAVPTALLAIAEKALAARPEARYRDAGELVDDLRRYQAGLAPTALRESLLARARRWHRRNARAFWSWTAAALVVLTLAGALYGEKLEQLARWGAPRSEPFTSETLAARWMLLNGGFHADGGRVVSEAEYNIITLKEPIQGAAAIEFDGEILPGQRPGDVSLMWSRGYDAKATWLARLVDGYCVQFGAWDGAWSGIARGVEPRETVAQSRWRPQVGRPFHARVEIEDNRIRMLVDGREICAWSDPLPIEGGYLSLFAFGPGKAYANLRVFRREIPTRVSAIAIGDEAARAKAYDVAFGAYARIAASHRDEPLGREALYKQGLCRWRQGQPDEALAIWDPVAIGPYAELVRLHRLERAFDLGRHDEVLARLPGLYRAADAEGRGRIALDWGQWTSRLRLADQVDVLPRYLALHDELMSDQPIADHSAAEALFKLGRGDELMRRYPQERYLCCLVLDQRGEYDRVLREYPDQSWPCVHARFMGALWEGMDRAEMGGLIDEIDWMRGRAAEVVERPGVTALIRAHALNVLGRYDEVVARARAQPGGIAPGGESTSAVVAALVDLGRPDEAAAISEPARRTVALMTGAVEGFADDRDPATRAWAGAILAIQAAARGELLAERAPDPPGPAPLDCEWPAFVDAWLLRPLLDGLGSGDFSRFDAVCAELPRRWRYAQRQRAGLVAGFIAGTVGEEALRHEPCELYAQLDLALARGLRAERATDRAAALAAWRGYLALPEPLRNQSKDGGIDAFVAWRVRALGER